MGRNWGKLLLEICISFYCGGGQKIQLAVISIWQVPQIKKGQIKFNIE
jgi:hypothetical protein